MLRLYQSLWQNVGPMTLYRGKYRVESTRLRGYDYGSEGWYFVTICVHRRHCIFGEVRGIDVDLTMAGQIAQRCWQEIPKHHRGVFIDQFIIMPNHMHGIVILDGRLDGPILGHVVRSYKAAVMHECHNIGLAHWRWQSRFYEEILHDADAVGSARAYMRMNPVNWADDPEYFPNALI